MAMPSAIPGAGASAALNLETDSAGLARVADLGSADISWQQPRDGAGAATADVLSRAFVIGSHAYQPIHAGMNWTETSFAEYWLDNLSL